MTPYACLEGIAAEVAPFVPGSKSIVHVEVSFDHQPFDVHFKLTPWDERQFFNLSERTPFVVPAELLSRTLQLANECFALTQPLFEQTLIFLRLSVLSNGNFFTSQDVRQGGSGEGVEPSPSC